MYLVGLTGGIGSGKTFIAELFRARGAAIVDTDLIAHRITAPQGAAMPLIEREFGLLRSELVDALNWLRRQ